MKTARTIRCKVITIEADPRTNPEAPAATSQPRFRPSDLLPWADPYIAGLVRKLQADVRQEVASANRAAATRFGAPVADLEWPWDEGVADFEPVTVEPLSDDNDDGLNWDHRFNH